MLNKLGTTEDMTEYHPNGKKSYDFRTHGLIIELTTCDEKGNELAFKNSRGYYEVNGKEVTKEEYEAFIQSLDKPKETTAMQFLLDELDIMKIVDRDKLIMAKHVIGWALEKEKHQTLLGVYEGQKNHSASDEENKIMAEHWYQENFKQNK